MNITNLKYIYLIGIGGIGMSGLARYFSYMGKSVSGYDKTPSSLTGELEEEGIIIHYQDDTNLIDINIRTHPSANDTLIIYTPAIPTDCIELNFFRENDFNIHKRAEVLSWIVEGYYTIAVAGSHGKTTTTALIAHLLKASNKECIAFLGGISKNYNSNVLLNVHPGSKNVIAVVEADEYDKSFLQLKPEAAVITSTDPDHLDIYHSTGNVKNAYRLFVNGIKGNGVLVTKTEIMKEMNFKGKSISYSLDKDTDYHTAQLSCSSGYYDFSIITPSEKIKHVKFGMQGLHNVENSVAAAAIAKIMNIGNEDIKNAFSSFYGVKRRFDIQIDLPQLVFIDDYAHHPGEIAALIKSVKELYPDKKITGIFQPHLYTRTRDFAAPFAASLSQLDKVMLLDIYPARELPIEGIDSEMLLKRIGIKNKGLFSKDNLIPSILNEMPEVLLTMGAGDIDRLVNPIKESILKKLSVK